MTSLDGPKHLLDLRRRPKQRALITAVINLNNFQHRPDPLMINNHDGAPKIARVHPVLPFPRPVIIGDFTDLDIVIMSAFTDPAIEASPLLSRGPPVLRGLGGDPCPFSLA